MCDEKISNSSEAKTEIKFKSKSRKQFRKRLKQEDSDDEDNSEVIAKLQEMREIQKLRERPSGVDIVGLALGTKITTDNEIKDPFNKDIGGLVSLKALSSGNWKVDDAYDTGIGTQFSVETNKRDEDEDMMKYIEVELSKRKGKEKQDEVVANSKKYHTPEEIALLSVPEHLRTTSKKQSEEMLSNQMLSGIPEVDLGIEAKIKNIEATEEAKLRLLWEKQNKKDGPSQFVPSNMAVNFVQHNRFNIAAGEVPQKKAKVDEKPKKKDEKATDDYHYERFKKQFKR
ncbi:splicing factor C9orf78 [Diorhabda carinulata]|uniref:splicing factor C9orf78 n=1 Tax=Diorhabda carinulata TaxID=1163345 RepID=UPI0025A021A0|nr:splicing factor C9orf78 [Diorhabda carinulata]